METTDRYAQQSLGVGLLGHPLGHSFSPVIFSHLGEEYKLYDVEKEGAEAIIKSGNFVGLNVTVPHKKTAFESVDFLDRTAAMCGAVNTVILRGGLTYGYNTDFFGMKAMLEYYGIDVKNKVVAIFGRGGTAGMAKVLMEHLGAKSVTMLGRTDTPDYENTEIIVNATPVGMFPNCDNAICDVNDFKKLSGVVDAVYNPLRTRLVYRAKKAGIPACNGLYMLVAQAVKSYDIFFNKTTPREKIDEIFRQILWEQSNLVIVGMPSSGKTVIGQYIAASAKKRFVDVDAEIVRKAGMSIPEIFDKKGEDFFRDLEQSVIAELSNGRGLLIATGGGSVIRKENRDALAQNGFVVFLQRDTDLLETAGRPLSKDKETIKKLFIERLPYYKEVADFEVENNGDIESCKQKIVSAVEKYFSHPTDIL